MSPAWLAAQVGLNAEDIEHGMRMLEGAGFVLRGRFTPGAESDEFCDRRLLARIHRYTLDRLRREIDPVSAQDYMRFLLRWQHLTPDSKLSGKMGVRQAIARLEGFEAAASAWERDLLASRLNDYRPSWLDELCLAGEVAWARLTPRKVTSSSTSATATRLTPVSLVLRPDLQSLLSGVRGAAGETGGPRAGAAAEIIELLRQRGALFFDEIVNGTRRLRSDVERGLRELIAWGLVTSDGFQGLRQLAGRTSPSGRRREQTSNYTAGGFFAGSGPAGRWALVPATVAVDDQDELSEATARILLHRYGVVFRDLYPRESFTVPWRDVLRALRRLEARGIVRGGRFVSGFNGEQYALPEAVDSLRWVRRQERNGERVWVSATDPVNVVGVVVPGERVAAQPSNGVLFVDGLPQAESREPSVVRARVPSKLSPRMAARPAARARM
jgi:ATP-dependent Lhr-like helicase